MPTAGSLFSGAGLLDAGLHMAGWDHAWFCESDPWRRGLLSARFPGVPVFDDVRTVSGQAATDSLGDGVRQQPEPERRVSGTPVAGRPRETAANADESRADSDPETGGPRSTASQRTLGALDLIVGGFPCKGASTAGKRNGFDHAETVLWDEMRRVIGALRPRYCLIENVANLLGMAASPGEPPGSMWGTVLGDLATLGFGDIRWDCVPAAAVGAPHLRDRVFCVAADTAGLGAGEPADAADTFAGSGLARPELASRSSGAPSDTPQPRWGTSVGPRQQRGVGSDARASSRGVAVNWGEYEPAIHRWESIHGPAPEPLIRRMDDGNPKLQRMRARVDRSRLSALGDGVHVYVGYLVGLTIRHHLDHGAWS